MLSYILKRLLLMIPTLIGITIVTFSISRLAPGDPVETAFGGRGGMGGGAVEGGGDSYREQQKMLELRKKKWGLDRPLHIQYFKWVGNFARGDFGDSFKYKTSVAEKIWPAMKVTVLLNVISLCLIYLLAVPLGIHAAIRRGKPDEKAIGVTLFGLYSAPSFWVATLALFYLCNPNHLRLFDGIGLHSDNYQELPLVGYFEGGSWHAGQLSDWLWHLVLPVICLTYNGLASLSRYARTGMLEVIRKDYIRTARAKGLPEKTVIVKHALRNSLIPIVTLMASLLPAMIGGSVIIEYIFTIRGMGMLSIESVLGRDYNMIMAIATLSAVLTLLGMLLSDILYTVVDPRISLE